MNEETFNQFKINLDGVFQKIEYIIKKQMFIFYFEKEKIIKILIHSLYPYKEIDKLINISFIFYYEKKYKGYYEIFEKMNSKEIIDILLNMDIVYGPQYKYIEYGNEEANFIVFNEEEYRISKCPKKNNNKFSFTITIKQLKNIIF